MSEAPDTKKPDPHWSWLVGFMRAVRQLPVGEAQDEGLLDVYELLRNHEVMVPLELRGEFLGQHCRLSFAPSYAACTLWHGHTGLCKAAPKEQP